MKPLFAVLVASSLLIFTAVGEQDSAILVESAEEVLSAPVSDETAELSDEIMVEFGDMLAANLESDDHSLESLISVINLFLGEATKNKGSRLGRDLVFAARFLEVTNLQEPDDEGELEFVTDSLDLDAPLSFMEAYLLTESLYTREEDFWKVKQDLPRIRAAITWALAIIDEQEPDSIDLMISFFNSVYSEVYDDESITLREEILLKEIGVLASLAQHDNTVIDEALTKIAAFKNAVKNPSFEFNLEMAEGTIDYQLSKLNEQGN